MTARISLPTDCLAVDLHVHTLYSKDSMTSLEDLTSAVLAAGLSGIAVTDHNQVEGALRLRDSAPFPVIVGEEVKTSEGEIIGLFLDRVIPARLSPEETIAAIREQGGVVYLPHPADRIRRSTLTLEATERIIGEVDVVEVINARVLSARTNAEALALAEKHDLAQGAGSDAHTPREVGAAYVLLPLCDLTDPASFLSAIASARVDGGRSHPAFHLASTFAKLRKRWESSRRPGAG